MPFLSLARMKYSLKKAERIYHRDDFSQLFNEGERISAYPIQLLFRISKIDDSQEKDFLQAAWVAPKRNFKKAVDRNLLKRRMKEAYRIHRIPLKNEVEKQHKSLHLIFIYTAKELLSYAQIEDKIILLLQRLQASRWER